MYSPVSSSSSFIDEYFAAEKQDNFQMLLIAAAGIAMAVFLLIAFDDSVYVGLSVGLLIVMITAGTLSYKAYNRSDKQRTDIVKKLSTNPLVIQQEEIPRVEQVVEKTFPLRQWIEIAMVLVGAILAVYFWPREEQHFWSGLGLALVVQGLLLITLDSLALKRAKGYLASLRQSVSEILPTV
jgi:hypothetical protein